MSDHQNYQKRTAIFIDEGILDNANFNQGKYVGSTFCLIYLMVGK